ncbi:MAG TPA: hypothetical protein VIQ74_13280 [Gemmatimonadaceae bacterium]
MLLGITPTMGVAAQGCSCQFNESNTNGRIAGAFGGGLFAGLIAAVLHVKHASELAAQPMVGPMATTAAGAAPTVAVSTGALSMDPVSDPRATGAAPAGDEGKVGDPARTVALMPAMSTREAQREGLIPPKTASFLPAFAMIGAGALLFGLLLLREKSRSAAGVRRRRR